MKPNSAAILSSCRHYQNDKAFQDFFDDSDTDDDSRCSGRPAVMASAIASLVSGRAGRSVKAELLFPGQDTSRGRGLATEMDICDKTLGSAAMSAPVGTCVLKANFVRETELQPEGRGAPRAQFNSVCGANGSGAALQRSFEQGIETCERVQHEVTTACEHGSVMNSPIAFDCQADAGDVHLTVYDLGGDVCTEVCLLSSSTVREIKLHVWESGGPRIANQVLMFGHEELVDSMTLQDSGISGKAELQLACMQDEVDHGCTKVVLRCRLMSHVAAEGGHQCSMDRALGEVTIRKAGVETQSKTFAFDDVLDGTCFECEVFHSVGLDLVDDFVAGYNCTAIAYGTTSSCKSFTLFGKGLDCPQDEQSLVPMSYKHLFKRLASMPSTRATLRCNFIAIHNERIYDLLSEDRSEVELKDDAGGHVYIKGASSRRVITLEDMDRALTDGLSNRSAALRASSPHQIHIQQTSTVFAITMETFCPPDQVCVRTLSIVEAPGSERQAVRRDALKDVARVNMSLSALSNVISALTDKKMRFIPYRDSKLTRLLKDSWGGSAKTVFIGHIDPTDYDETLSTLRFVHRAKSIKNKPRVNVFSRPPPASDLCGEEE